MITHPIPPEYDCNSNILILGSFPSVKSREIGFFYGHKQNRFWKVLATVFDADTPSTVSEKKDFLHTHHIALWDVLYSCDIKGSSDSSIKNAIPNDIRIILDSCNIKTVFVNGKTALKYYNKYIYPNIKIPAVYLPSTSAANASYSFEKLVFDWGKIKV